MANLLKVIIEPAILKYARFCSGYEIPEVAKKANITKEFLEQCEQEKTEVSIARLEKLAGVYKIPLAYFFLKQIPRDVVLPKDFRKVFSYEDIKLSPKTMLAVRRARYVQSVIRELEGNEIKYNFRKSSLDDSPEDVAQKLRSLLGMSVDNQSESSQFALKQWKEVIEKIGIFILQQSLPEKEVSAFSLVDQTPYVIVLNSLEHENRRVFSLFHEMGHLFLRASGVCTPEELSKNSFEYVKIEKFCNQFAASFLVPKVAFLKNPDVKRLINLPFTQWNSDSIEKISKYFRVSQEVIYRRFNFLEIITDSEYKQIRTDLIKGFEEYKNKNKNKEFRIPQYIKIISRNGGAFSSFILENLHMNKITMVDAANYLDTTSKHITAVELHI